ncbi:hypothetical protein [Chondrinema litorale]|uniref:hypothetical protein n=1 Tax=Chondrinema litorale TaxID=2994555 RepID=UPI002543277F|nr:hypothetical protein [Chondrinema litorale]UZR99281.1 hypothetical protein OQ292_35455 [Chondrinema litorale]
MKFLITILLLVTFSHLSAQKFTVSFSEKPVHIDLLSTKLPVVEGTLNNKKAYFLIDTGSSITLLDLTQKRDYAFNVFKKLSRNINGFGGKNLNLWMLFDVNVNIGGKYISTPCAGAPLQQLRASIKSKTGYEISGIIGSDAMRDYGIIVDYVNKKCVLGAGKNMQDIYAAE